MKPTNDENVILAEFARLAFNNNQQVWIDERGGVRYSKACWNPAKKPEQWALLLEELAELEGWEEVLGILSHLAWQERQKGNSSHGFDIGEAVCHVALTVPERMAQDDND